MTPQPALTCSPLVSDVSEDQVRVRCLHDIVRATEELVERVQDLEDSRELMWSTIIATLYDRLHRLEDRLRGVAIEPEELYDVDKVLLRTTLRALAKTDGNKMATARLLRVNVKTLYNWMERWGLRQKGDRR